MSFDIDDVTTEQQFNDALEALLAAAADAGIEVAGGWECRIDGGCPDWEVVIIVLADRDGAPPG